MELWWLQHSEILCGRGWAGEHGPDKTKVGSSHGLFYAMNLVLPLPGHCKHCARAGTELCSGPRSCCTAAKEVKVLTAYRACIKSKGEDRELVKGGEVLAAAACTMVCVRTTICAELVSNTDCVTTAQIRAKTLPRPCLGSAWLPGEIQPTPPVYQLARNAWHFEYFLPGWA